ncbi:efflux RND transporter periplasmic adaptor subunit [Cohaesibacter intestini]|uniref:efflux RND transporter periplasmic adaptor subunit n=1 Tax=Cohaesibacter intestini TaxID=2211145 RepID=UPI000DE81B55|nr:efflux RND transporter periplasmic adaptor subunit [Cohaesibacter intestini]
MNMITEQERKIAQTLRSLSDDAPVDHPTNRMQPSVRQLFSRKRVFLLSAGALLIIGSVVLLEPDLPAAFHKMLGTPAEKTLTQKALQTKPDSMLEGKVKTLQPALPVAVPAQVTGSGYVVAPDKVTLFAQYAGRITEVSVKPGDKVTSGQALVTLDDLELRLAVQQAIASRKAAVLALEAARIASSDKDATFKRHIGLNKRGIVSDTELQKAKVAALKAKNMVEQARVAADKSALDLRDAEAKRADLTIRSPISGTVLQVAAHKGDRVPDFADAIRSNGLVAIARFDQLVIDADVAEKALGGLTSGLEGEATLDAFADQPFAVAIQRIAPEVNSAKGTVSLRLVPKNPPVGIRPGMAARIRIILTKPDPSSNQQQGTQQP